LSIFGATFDESLDDEIRVTVIATGFEDDNKPETETEKPTLEPLDPVAENAAPKKNETDPDFDSILDIFKNKNF
jgi:cell division protein FtsZ